MGEKARPQCYFEVEINREPIGRIVLQLFSDVCPKTCMNFLCLCTGEKGIGKVTQKKLCYKGSTFHRVVKNFMIQGGDFSEGNGKGGESIYGGYFEDENFTLKHDRAFLLSMANRGKHTNGSQFFITTKPAPHLDGIHVVFGLVISGFEVIEQIESLKTDAASRPYADVRVIDCGLLATKPAKDVSEKIKRVTSHSEESGSKSSSPSSSSSSSESSSESEVAIERSRRRKRKRKTKPKLSKRRRKEPSKKEAREKRAPSQHSNHSGKNGNVEDSFTKREKLVVRPEEIPPVPENRFLLRRDVPPAKQDLETKPLNLEAADNDQHKSSLSKSGRKIKGRGTIRYHTPPRSRSHSESQDDGESSETPPHWKEEMQRLRTYKPPTGEKWSKGDKLSNRFSSHWDDDKMSPRSSSWSHDGYQSNESRERVSHTKTRKKDKKLKHKKKSKKVKHSKKHKPTKKSHPTLPKEESSHSPTKKQKTSHEQVKESFSGSSRESSKKNWSPSDKEQRFSVYSSKGSQFDSRSRSYSRGSSRSASKSSSHSSRSRTRSRSRNRNRSRSRSKSHPSSSPKPKQPKKVSLSPKSREVPVAEFKPGIDTELVKSAAVQVFEKTAVPFTENIPVIPLSDSPPPSRWKPGQKPWKPSYERIQEIKATDIIPAQKRRSVEDKRSSSYRRHRVSSDSESSDYSGRSSSYQHKSKFRSSRSRSYSRSYTRSRSPSSSSSRTDVHSDSSCDRSSSYDSSSERRLVRNKSSKETKTAPRRKGYAKRSHQDPKRNVKPRDSPKSMSSNSDSDSSTDRGRAASREKVENRNGVQTRATDVNVNETDKALQNQRSTTVSGTEDTMVSEVKDLVVDQVVKSEESKGNITVPVEEASRSESTPAGEDMAVSSGKEEGEASSESDNEAARPLKPVTADDMSPPASEETAENLTKSRSSSPENIKTKSKKRKHRSSKKSGKKSHLKKAKEKSKKKKLKKRKVPKKKQIFHWQPPLEFGEEEEEDVANEKPSKEVDGQTLARDKQTGLKNKSSKVQLILMDKEKAGGDQFKIVTPMACPDKTEENDHVPSLDKSQTSGKATPNTDNVKTFTKNLTVNPVKLEPTSLGQTQGGCPAVTSEKTLPPSTSVTTVTGENSQVKAEKSSSPQLKANNPAVPEKAAAANSDSTAGDNKWKPVQGPSVLQMLRNTSAPVNASSEQEKKSQGLRIEIKSKNKVRPGSLFDEVRKTARLNQRPRNQESSSNEESTSHDEKSRTRSRTKSRSVSSDGSRSRSYSRSRSRSRSYSSSSRSRSFTRSRSRRSYRRTRSRSRSYRNYRRHSRMYSVSRSRSRSRSRGRSRSRSHTYDSYDSTSRSRSPPRDHRSRSYDRRSSRSRRSYTSYSGSDRSYRRHRRRSGRS
ncbi:NK-tumor recognition protein [Pelodytes ibericus]